MKNKETELTNILQILIAQKYSNINRFCEVASLDVQSMKGVINGELSIGKVLAVRMAKYLGKTPEFWRKKNYKYNQTNKNAA